LLKIGRPRREELGRLKSYNQYASHYESVAAMTADLPRVAALGCNSVWINPLFERCASLAPMQEEILRGIAAYEAEWDDRLEPTHKKLTSKVGRPYAQRSFYIDHRHSSSPEVPAAERMEQDYAEIRAYTDKAREVGLTPLYDFVMRHVAVDHPLVKENPHWFKRHDNGNFVIFGRDEISRKTGQSWDDVVEFDYSTPEVRREIIDTYLKPMADLVVSRFGFEGLRIDAAGMIPREVYEEITPYIDNLSIKQFGKPAVMMGETLGQDVSHFIGVHGFLDYCYNSIYYRPFTRENWENDDSGFTHAKGILQATVGPTVGFPDNHDVVRMADFYYNQHHIRGRELLGRLEELVADGTVTPKRITSVVTSLAQTGVINDLEMRTLVFHAFEHKLIDFDKQIELQSAISQKSSHSAISQHELQRWLTPENMATKQGRAMLGEMLELVGNKVKKGEYEERNLIKWLPGKLPQDELQRMIKEAFCFVAFCSDGGWFLSYGGEWAATSKTSVFDAKPSDMQQRAYPGIDISPFIREINAIVTQLPAPASLEWTQRCYLDDRETDKKLASFYFHQGSGLNGHSHLVVANVSEEPFKLKEEQFREIISANHRNGEHIPKDVYIIGDIKFEFRLEQALRDAGCTVHFSSDALSQAKQRSGWTDTPGG
jgi:hypothetical protein